MHIVPNKIITLKKNSKLFACPHDNGQIKLLFH